MTDPYPGAMPESVQRVTIDTPDGPLAALDAWPAQGSPFHGTAVMVPGFTGSKEDFIPMLATIVSAGYRVVCYDQRGQYESAGPSRAAAYSIEAFAKDLSGVIGSIADGQPVHLLGHSFGGLVARRAVIAVPGTPAWCAHVEHPAGWAKGAGCIYRAGGIASRCPVRPACLATLSATKEQPRGLDRDLPCPGH